MRVQIVKRSRREAFNAGFLGIGTSIGRIVLHPLVQHCVLRFNFNERNATIL